MSIVKKIEEQDMTRFVEIAANAYPATSSAPDFKEKARERYLTLQQSDAPIKFYGLYRNEELLGGMRFHDYKMNLLGQDISIGGVGLVAVDLLHKKEKVAKELIEYFLKHYWEKGLSFVALYPFRPDFYKKMGFGYGAKIDQYRVRPDSFPSGNSKKNLSFFDKERDRELLLECFTRFASNHHGMFYKTKIEFEALINNQENRIVVYKQHDQIQGYLVFSFKKAHEENFSINDLHIKEFIYEDPSALQEISSFLHSQNDQINRIVFHTQDPFFHYLLNDPRNGSNNLIPPVYHESHTTGVGLMYRIIDIPKFFADSSNRNYNSANLKLKLTVVDSFWHRNQGSYIIHFNDGIPSFNTDQSYSVEMKIDISDLSSLMMGAVHFNTLYQYGLVEVGDSQFLSSLHQLFYLEDQPICMTGF